MAMLLVLCSLNSLKWSVGTFRGGRKNIILEIISDTCMFVIIPLLFPKKNIVWEYLWSQKLVNVCPGRAITVRRRRHCCYVTWLLLPFVLGHVVEHMKWYIFEEIEEQVIWNRTLWIKSTDKKHLRSYMCKLV